MWIKATLIGRFMGPTWGPSGVDRTQVGSMLAPCTLLSRYYYSKYMYINASNFHNDHYDVLMVVCYDESADGNNHCFQGVYTNKPCGTSDICSLTKHIWIPIGKTTVILVKIHLEWGDFTSDCCKHFTTSHKNPHKRIRGPFHERFFYHNPNSMEIGEPIAGYRVATRFRTCHDSTAVVPCTWFHYDNFDTTWMNAEWHFHRIWITMDKVFHEMDPSTTHDYVTIIQCAVLMWVDISPATQS